MHLTKSPVDWYAARAAGVAAYLLLTTVVCLGLTMAGRKEARRWPRFALEEVHRFGGLLVGSFVVIHVLAIAIDAYLPFSFWALIVPFVAGVPPALHRAGDRRGRAPAGTRGDEPLPRPPRLSLLAPSPLPQLRSVGCGHGAWARQRDRSQHAVADGALRRGGGRRPRRERLSLPARGRACARHAAQVCSVVLLGAGPLRFSPRAWNARSFDGTLTGRVCATSDRHARSSRRPRRPVGSSGL